MVKKSMFYIIETMKDSQETALINIDGKKMTYCELYCAATRMAKQISSCGKHVILLFPNDFDFVIALFAIWCSGRTAIPMGAHATDSEICAIANYCDVDSIILGNEDYPRNLGKLNKIIAREPIEENVCSNNSQEKISFDCNNPLAFILPTTGTTSSPKCVQITHHNLDVQVKGYVAAFNCAENFRELILVPLTYVAALISQLLVVLYVKSFAVLYRGSINPSKIVKLINEYRIIFTGAPPSIINIIAQNMQAGDMASLKGLILGGEKVTKDTVDKLSMLLPFCQVIQAYGLTETCSFATGYMTEETVPSDSAGKPLPHFQIKIVNEQNLECEVGLCGHILVKGESITPGYYKNDALNAVAFVDGWFKTGDIGKMDKLGFVYIVGRLKNLIISGGQNIYPEEVEECLLTYPNVIQAYVYGDKHAVLGEAPSAKVVVQKGCVVTDADLYHFCKERIAVFKIPKKIIFVDELPYNSNGKMQRT